MPVVEVFNQNNVAVSTVELKDEIFGVEPKEHLFHLMVRYQLAKRRRGTHSVKGRAQVSGGGKKPWKQKGTGRARQGSSRSTHWRGGGVVHGPVVRDHSIEVPKKVRALALKSALSRRLAERNLWVLDKVELEEIKTRKMAEIVNKFGWDEVLVVLPEQDEAVQLASRNLPGVKVLPAIGLNVYDILSHRHLAITLGALERVNERFGR